MKTRAFTIVEVLISVIILATVATLLFQISIKSKNNYIFYQKKQNFENIASLGLLRELKSNTNIYELIRSDYKIKDFDFRKYLKSIKLKKEENQFSKIILNDKEENENQLSLNITQIKIYSKKNSTYYYSIGF